MQSESVVYGCIKHLPCGDAEAQSLRCFHNREVISRLPPSQSWQLLTFDMCSVSDEGAPGDRMQTQVMHFGRAYAGVEYEWKCWTEQFELLLQQLYWVSAVVHLETEFSGNHTFVWETTDIWHEPGMDLLQLRCEWCREGVFR